MISPDTLLQNRYLVLEQIGKGGMGLVYRATDQRFGSTVALKEIFLDAPHLRKAFEREAILLNHLRHPALPRVSDHFTEEDGGQFIVMEFIPGDDLSVMLKEKKVPFPLSNALDWADQLLDALEYLHAHEPAIVHRDIKPQNLKLMSRGHIILLDFGLAKGTPQAAQATATGSVFGYSFNYAPLEQMQGTGTDPRSDLYSLGATLYHLMTGVTPPDALTRATAVLNGEADPLRPADKVQAQVTAPVARLLERAMAQSAAQRPQTAAEMRAALREACKQNGAALVQNGAALSPFDQTVASVANVRQQKAQLGRARATKPVTTFPSSDSLSTPQDAMTVVQPPLTTGKPRASRENSYARDSVVTKVRPIRPPAPQGGMSARTIGILTGVVLLLAAAVAVYAFTRQPKAQSPGVQTAPLTGDTAATTPQAETPPAVATQAPAQSPSLSSAPASSQQSGNQPESFSPTNPVAENQTSQAPAPANDAAAVQPNTQAAPNANAVQLTPEAERARQADEIRRQNRERDEQEMKRKREELEKERDREIEIQRERERLRVMQQQQQQPSPPFGFPPPPPPGRSGPPPF